MSRLRSDASLRGWIPAGPALILLLLFPRALGAQEVGGMLFSYEPFSGERAVFDAGYRSHLEWHRAHGDSLDWYGWDVIAGERVDQFVDGTFGISFEALDRRVDPAGDAADAEASFAAHARASNRWAVRLRPGLSTTTPLEEGVMPPPFVEVVTFTVPVDASEGLEAALRRVRDGAARDHLLPYAVYETLVGTTDSEFTVMVWRQGLAGLDHPDRDPVTALRGALSPDFRAAVRVERELWHLRTDLTLLAGHSAHSASQR